MKTISQLQRAAFRINRQHKKAFAILTGKRTHKTNVQVFATTKRNLLKLVRDTKLTPADIAFWRQKMVLALQARIELGKEIARRHIGLEGVRCALPKKQQRAMGLLPAVVSVV